MGDEALSVQSDQSKTFPQCKNINNKTLKRERWKIRLFHISRSSSWLGACSVRAGPHCRSFQTGFIDSLYLWYTWRNASERAKRHRRTISVFWFCFFFWVFGFWGLSTNEADLAWAIATFWHKRSNLIQRLSRVVVCVCFFAWKKTGSDKVDSVTETWKGRIACHRLSLKLDTGIS